MGSLFFPHPIFFSFSFFLKEFLEMKYILLFGLLLSTVIGAVSAKSHSAAGEPTKETVAEINDANNALEETEETEEGDAAEEEEEEPVEETLDVEAIKAEEEEA